MVSAQLLIITLLNGVALGAIYVLTSSGLSVIFGVSNILNIAHGAFYMLGAYFGVVLVDATGNFWLALIVAPLAVGVVGMLIERVTLHYIYGRDPLYHVLLTFGLSLMMIDGVRFIFGPGRKSFATPEMLVGSFDLGITVYPQYKLFVIGFSAVVALGTWLVLKYTSFGLIIRAGAQRADTVEIMGIDISRYFTFVFGFGTALAAVAGVLVAPFLSVTPSMGFEVIITAFIVVILGGLGSFAGSVVAGVLVGIIEVFGQTFLPELSGFLVFILLIIVLLVRPQGLMGNYEVRSEMAKLNFDEIIRPVRLTDRRVLGLIAAALVFPFVAQNVLSPFFVGLVSLIFIWAIFAMGLDLVVGQLGLLSFGHAAFFGTGAYAAALFALHVQNSFLLSALVSVTLVAIIAWAVGALSLRLAGVYFAIITVAIGQTFYQASVDLDGLTGGSNGLRGLPGFELLGLDLGQTVLFYYLSFLILLGVYKLLVYLTETPFGHALAAIRESERRMSFVGYNVDKYKRRAFMLSGAIGGLAGTLFAVYQNFVTPSLLFWRISGDALFVVILGGVNTIFGPIFGSAFFIGLEQLVSAQTTAWRFYLGLLLVLIVLFAPRGLVSVYRNVRTRLGGGDVQLSARDAGIGDEESIDHHSPEE